MLYVLRHTYGYHETAPKAITLEEFQHGRKRRDGTRIDAGTGLSRSAVVDGLRCAVAAGLLREEVDARDRARIVKRYAIALREESPMATAEEQAVQSDWTLQVRERLTLIQGQREESPKATSVGAKGYRDQRKKPGERNQKKKRSSFAWAPTGRPAARERKSRSRSTTHAASCSGGSWPLSGGGLSYSQ